MTTESTQEEWARKTLEYVSQINAFVDRGLREGWDNVGEEPAAPALDHLAMNAIEAVRQANETGNVSELRDLWPPAHSPLIPLLEQKGQSIPVIYLLPDNSIIARIGAPYEIGRTVLITDDKVTELSDIGFFGRSPNRRYFAIAESYGVRILEDWNGPEVAICRWPTGLEGIPEGFEVEPLQTPPKPTRLIPFPDGKHVLLVSEEGIFVLSKGKAIRLLPTKEEIKDHFEWLQQKYPEDALKMSLSMEHGSVSSDGKYIAVGSQDSTHLIFDQNLSLIGDVGNRSEYPHYALFSSDNEMIAFNSCHFYNGITIGVPLSLLPGLKTKPYEEDSRVILLDDSARVYAGVSRKNEFIIGDAGGYVSTFATNGDHSWRFFIGSTIGDIDISSDGKTLVVSTYAGFLSIIQMDAGRQAPHQIGNSKHLETRRWIFWKDEPKPLIW